MKDDKKKEASASITITVKELGSGRGDVTFKCMSNDLPEHMEEMSQEEFEEWMEGQSECVKALDAIVDKIHGFIHEELRESMVANDDLKVCH